MNTPKTVASPNVIGTPLLVKIIEVIYAPTGITRALSTLVSETPFIVVKLNV